MKIKKISKEELAEGITVELVNKINMTRGYSPVQLQPGDEPVNILGCSTGFWVMIEGKALKDELGKMIVWGERECQVGRARYLVNYGQQEKEAKTLQLVEQWRSDVRKEIDKVKHRIEELKPSEFSEMVIEGLKGKKAKEQYRQEKANELERLTPLYNDVEEAYTNNKLIELLTLFNLKKFDTLMLSADLNNRDDMIILLNTFSAEEIEKWNGNMAYKYAQIEIEKQYPI